MNLVVKRILSNWDIEN